MTETQIHKRRTDSTNADARDAVAATQAQFIAWRHDLASFAARAGRSGSDAGRDSILARCAAISDEVQAARAVLLVNLMDAPQKVTGHSRVVDVEKALDNVEDAVSALRRKLNG